MQRLTPSPFETLTRDDDLPAPAHELPRSSSSDPFRREMPSFASAFPPVSSRAAMQEAMQDEARRNAARGADPMTSDLRIEPSLPDPVEADAPTAAFSSKPEDLSVAPKSPELKLPERAADPFEIPRPADRIDAQLSELLGEAALPVGAREGFFPPSPAQTTASPGAMGRLSEGPSFANLGRANAGMPQASPAPASSPAPRPGFTVSRVGYMADDIPAASPKAEDDPFEFNLGPSPFARAKVDDKIITAEPAPAAVAEPQSADLAPATAAPAASFASDIDALIAKVATSTAATVATSPAAGADTAQETLGAEAAVADAPAAPEGESGKAHADAVGVSAPAAAEAIEPEAAAAVEETAAVATPEAPAVAVAVDAPAAEIEKVRDILPLAAGPSPVAAPTAASAPAMTGLQSLMRSQAQSEYLSAPPSAYAPSAYAPAAYVPAAIETSGTVLPPSQRTAEEALAELLRPMLRSWLAENMPKIVERALRQELAGQISADQKTAAE